MVEEQVLTGSRQFAEPMSHTSCDNELWCFSHKEHPVNVIPPQTLDSGTRSYAHVQTSLINPENPIEAYKALAALLAFKD